MSTLAGRITKRIMHYADRPWFLPYVAVMAALDAFVLLIPTDGLLITATMIKPKRWIPIALIVTTGSTLGAVAIAWVTAEHGTIFIEWLMPAIMHSPEWEKTRLFVDNHGGWAMLLIAAGPFPLQPGALLAGLAEMPLLKVFAWVWVGRALKYLLFCWIASHAPRLLKKFWGVNKEIAVVQESKEDEK